MAGGWDVSTELPGRSFVRPRRDMAVWLLGRWMDGWMGGWSSREINFTRGFARLLHGRYIAQSDGGVGIA